MRRPAEPIAPPEPDPGRWHRLKELVADALELPVAVRHAHVAARTGDAPELGAEALAMLAAATTGADFLEPAFVVPPAVAPLQAGERLGAYVVEALVGEGGFSEVYRARQEEPLVRQVALKVLKPGLDSRAVLERFALERRTLARLEHPGIARILDAGATAHGRPFVVVEYVAGSTLAVYVAQHQPELGERLRLFLQVLDAVAHAHRRGVIHRDLKPGNLLVRCDGDGAQVVVIDFGIAKVMDGDNGSTTRQGQFLGTAEYCSPEQRHGDIADIDVRADVYALGVVLGELLVGHRLAAGEAWPRHLPRELGWIVAMATAADRAARYDGVGELAADVRAFQTVGALRAGPATLRYRLATFARRHHLALGAALLVLLALGGGGVAAAIGYWRAEGARHDAQLARQEATSTADYLAQLLAAVSPGKQGRDVRVRDLLDASGALLERAAAVPAVAARLHLVVGQTYGALGEFAAAEAHLRSARQRYVAAFGELDWRAIEAGCDLAGVLHQAGRLDEAAPLVEAMAAQAVAARGEQHPRARSLLDMRAKLAFDRGRPAEAEAPLRALLALAEADGRPDPVIALAGNLAQVLLGLRRTAEAAALAQRALALALANHGADHPLALAAARKLAAVHLQEGDHQAMVDELQPLLPLADRRLGADHPDTLGIRNYYATALQGLGRRAEAAPVFRELIAAQARKLDRLHPQVLMTLHNFGTLLAAEGDHAGAEQVLRDAAARLAEARGADDRETCKGRYFLAVAIAAQGRHREIAADFAAAVAALQCAYPPGEPFVREVRRSLLRHLLALADDQQAAGEAGAARATWMTARDLARELGEAGAVTRAEAALAQRQ